ncbi:MAG: hypothetical protein ACQES0_10215 [Bacteroidota bacterium]
MLVALNLQEWTELLSVIMWPLVVIAILLMFRKFIIAGFSKVKSFRVRDIEAEFYEREKELTETEIMPLQDEITSLENRIEAMENKIDHHEGLTQKPGEEQSESELRETLKSVLGEGPYRWRTVNKLMMLSGATAPEVIKLLENDPDVILQQTRAGKQIARLKSR